MKKLFPIFIIILLFHSCSDKYRKVSNDKFIGTWELQGASILTGIHVKITKEDGGLKGRIVKLNENKYVTLFADSADTWISGIERSSNFSFIITENKLGKPLFGLYGLPTSQQYKAEFINDNTIGLAIDSSDPKRSSRVYVRINN
ncbi:hypothetical protein ACE01N_00990 [Saccharicrinis sp. FJH2]|uniref:hypothetical protein n=1 Tax=unclassified Saccharicrinis TaxID=2646859 RepID=UPI0035D44A0A